MWCVGSVISCSRLKCWHISLTFCLDEFFKISRLKSPVINILFTLVSKARPIESSISDKISAEEFGGL